MTARRRVLIIDDSPLVVEAVRGALDVDGISVEGLADLTALADTPLADFHLILIDVQMPTMFGDDVAAVIRHRIRFKAPIVLLSVLPEPELAARVRDAGVDGYIQKQAGMDGVVDEIRAWLAGERPRAP